MRIVCIEIRTKKMACIRPTVTLWALQCIGECVEHLNSCIFIKNSCRNRIQDDRVWERKSIRSNVLECLGFVKFLNSSYVICIWLRRAKEAKKSMFGLTIAGLRLNLCGDSEITLKTNTNRIVSELTSKRTAPLQWFSFHRAADIAQHLVLSHPF